MRLHLSQQLISILLFPLLVSGCSWFYPLNRQQGNIITDNQIEQLKKGMSINEVKALLGTPVLNQKLLIDESNVSEQLLIEDKADITKMEYISLYQLGNDQPARKRISLLFENTKLIKFQIL